MQARRLLVLAQRVAEDAEGVGLLLHQLPLRLRTITSKAKSDSVPSLIR